MKKTILTLFCLFLITAFSFSQTYLSKQWDYRFGGSNVETLTALLKTADGGFLLGGYTKSDSGGDVTEPLRGVTDYWIVRTDSIGNKLWDKRFGGNAQERLLSFDQTTDGGFILGGFTGSDSGGDVSQASQGSVDYWIVKIDSLGGKQWDKRFGGNNADNLSSVQQTADGGYILGGFSNSDSSGDVSQPSLGADDYWIVKTDQNGIKLWDKRYGGNSIDDLFFLQQTSDGKYILGGYSASDSGGDVSQPSRGLRDYWLVKTDQSGNKLWDKRYGGNDMDNFVSLQQTNDGGYILGGYTRSDSSGEVSEPSRDTSLITIDRGDNWIVKTDSSGNKLWDKRFGGVWVEDAFGYVTQTNDGGYLLGGSSYSGSGGDKTENNLGMEQSWIIKTDSAGNKLWDKTIFTNKEDEFAYPIQVSDSCYVIANWSFSDSAGYKTQASRNGTYDFWFTKFCETSQPQLPIANFSVNYNFTCASGCFSFQNLSYNAGSFQWFFPGAVDTSSTLAAPSQVCYNDTGNYTVTLIAFNSGGSDTLTQVAYLHIYSLPVFNITVSGNGDTLFAPQGYTNYQWYLNNSPLSGDTTYFLIPTQSGDFVVTLNDANGCPGSDTLLFNVGVSDYSAPGFEISVFPNPVMNELNVRGLDFAKGGELKIHDLPGREIYSAKIASPEVRIQTADFAPGIYILEAVSEHQKYFLRFVKE